MAADTEPAAKPVEELLAAGKAIIEEARTTIAELDAMTNTAVLPVVVAPATEDAAPT
jgi:hypothetical protein